MTVVVVVAAVVVATVMAAPQVIVWDLAGGVDKRVVFDRYPLGLANARSLARSLARTHARARTHTHERTWTPARPRNPHPSAAAEGGSGLLCEPPPPPDALDTLPPHRFGHLPQHRLPLTHPHTHTAATPRAADSDRAAGAGRAHPGGVAGVAFLGPRRVASGGADCSIKTWSV